MKQFFEITKRDDEKRMAWGYASTGTVDSQGEIVTQEAVKKAWDEYIQFGNIREMHQPSAVGVVKEHSFDNNGVMIGAHIVDDAAWAKVVNGVYKGFSIGGKRLPGGYDALTKTVNAMKLTEISLVDRPANPEAMITMWKADDMGDATKTATDELLELLTKGNTTADQLLTLFKAQNVVKPKTYLAELRKSFSLLKAEGEDLRKGLDSVASLAGTIQGLKWIQNSIAQEAVQEMDGSELPGKLAAVLTTLCDLLVQLAEEEAGEVVESLKVPGDTSIQLLEKLFDGVDKFDFILDTANIQKFDSIQLLGKLFDGVEKFDSILDTANIQKFGARNNASDQERIQKAHDLLMEMGAACKNASPVQEVELAEKLEKAVEEGKIAKLYREHEKMAGEVGALRKALTDIQTVHVSLQKRYLESPSEPKAILKIVGKELDTEQDEEVDLVLPVVKNNGTIDEIATMIKKIHAGR